MHSFLSTSCTDSKKYPPQVPEAPRHQPPTLTPSLCYCLAGRFMHILPGGLWSVIAPLQLNPTFRRNHRTAHRRLGRLFIFMSVSISFGLMPIVLGGATNLRKSVRRSRGFQGGRGIVCCVLPSTAVEYRASLWRRTKDRWSTEEGYLSEFFLVTPKQHQ